MALFGAGGGPREVQLFHICFTTLAFFSWTIFSLLNKFNKALFVECLFLARCC